MLKTGWHAVVRHCHCLHTCTSYLQILGSLVRKPFLHSAPANAVGRILLTWAAAAVLLAEGKQLPSLPAAYPGNQAATLFAVDKRVLAVAA